MKTTIRIIFLVIAIIQHASAFNLNLNSLLSQRKYSVSANPYVNLTIKYYEDETNSYMYSEFTLGSNLQPIKMCLTNEFSASWIRTVDCLDTAKCYTKNEEVLYNYKASQTWIPHENVQTDIFQIEGKRCTEKIIIPSGGKNIALDPVNLINPIIENYHNPDIHGCLAISALGSKADITEASFIRDLMYSSIINKFVMGLYIPKDYELEKSIIHLLIGAIDPEYEYNYEKSPYYIGDITNIWALTFTNVTFGKFKYVNEQQIDPSLSGELVMDKRIFVETIQAYTDSMNYECVYLKFLPDGSEEKYLCSGRTQEDFDNFPPIIVNSKNIRMEIINIYYAHYYSAARAIVFYIVVYTASESKISPQSSAMSLGVTARFAYWIMEYNEEYNAAFVTPLFIYPHVDPTNNIINLCFLVFFSILVIFFGFYFLCFWKPKKNHMKIIPMKIITFSNLNNH